MKTTKLMQLLAVGTCAVAVAWPVYAGDQSFSIPEGDLKTALVAFGDQSGRPVIYRADDVRSVRSPGYRGNVAPIAALQAILTGTSLEPRVDASGAIAIVPAGIAGAAQSQAAASAPPEDRVVVTATRIARPDLETASPVTTVDAEEIETRQPISAEELVRNLPSVRPARGSTSSGVSNSAATIDLRGLGDNRSLVLLNGQRIVPQGLDGATDVNTVPIGLIERVDVVTGGASSVYGADAVAGVVNFITRRDFEGAELRGSFRVNERGDGTQYRTDVLLGSNFADSRGNAVLGISYAKQNPFTNQDRDIVVLNSNSGLPAFSNNAAPSIFQSSLRSATNPNGLPTSGFGSVIDPASGLFRAATQEDLFDANAGLFIQRPSSSVGAYAATRFELSPAAELYASALYSKIKVEIASSPAGTGGGTYALPLNNPYLPSGARSQLCAANNISVADCAAAAAVTTGVARTINVIPSRRLVEFNNIVQQAYDTTLYQIQVGLRGEITEALDYDLSVQYGSSDQDELRSDTGASSKVRQALLAYRNAAGAPVCSDVSNGCVPLNIFGAPGSISAEQLNFLRIAAEVKRKSELAVATGSISGDLFGLNSPLAENVIAFSLGGEYRYLRTEQIPDQFSSIQGEVLNFNARRTADVGDYDVKEVFGEVIVPLIEENFLESATAEAGVRFSDYSTTGSSLTWKVGGSIEPIDGIKFRAMRQVAVRSPNILELFRPASVQGSTAVDPCAGPTPATTRELCEATGAPVGSYGGIPVVPGNAINQTVAGNPNLDVERAKTYTVGAVFTPSFVPRFSLTIDYFNIRITDLISAPSQNDILNGCYSRTLNPSQTLNNFCTLIQRNPLTGTLFSGGAAGTPGVILASSNLGTLETAGVDLGVNYQLPLGPGDVNFGVLGTWLDYRRIQATPNSVFVACEGYFGGSCGLPRAEYRWNARVGYAIGGVNASLLWSYISGTELEEIRPTGLGLNDPGPSNTPAAYNAILPQFREIDAGHYFDLSLKAAVYHDLEVGLLIQNLLDTGAPQVGTQGSGGNTYPELYDLAGRSFTVSAKMRF